MTIHIESLTFECIIGILDFERQKAQKVIVDLINTEIIIYRLKILSSLKINYPSNYTSLTFVKFYSDN